MDSYKDPKPGKTYISPSLEAFGYKGRKIRIASKVIDSVGGYEYAKEKDEVILRQKENAATYIVAKFFEDNNEISVLSIQKAMAETHKPYGSGFSFVGAEISKLLEFIANIQSVSFPNDRAINISDEELRRIMLSNKQATSLVVENEDLFSEILKSAITKNDLVAVAYRKKQLEVFRRLIEDQSYFDSHKVKKNCAAEGLWQMFFEKNPWIFGYGLSYIYLSGFDEKKLEQVVHGYRIGLPGKRADALLRTRGAISNLCFVEIKTHRTDLLSTKFYRKGCWAPSVELAGAVSQVQGTVSYAAESIRERLTIDDSDGFPTGEEAFNYLPKSYLVIGSLKEFVGEHGPNQEKYRSFELYRRNTVNPEIITFDELYERAKFIVHASES
jgi:hypothetical protein